MKYDLIITEKPSSAKKIAEALANGKPIKKTSLEKVVYWDVTHGDKDIIIVSAVGHIYGLKQKEGTLKSLYPVFDIEWAPSADIGKGSEYTRQYLSTIKRLAKDASSFTVATDYDIEGEVIGLNIVRFTCGKKDAHRMKFSTLTKEELTKAYANRAKTLDWPQARAGETRHKMDWYFGINLSRALTASMKAAGNFKLMSTGRVQGPALKLIVDKEKEIAAFIPEPYWMIQLDGEASKQPIIAIHKEDKIFDKKRAEEIFNRCGQEKTAVVADIQKSTFTSMPPTPFDLTTLQMEANRSLGISPKITLEIAQELYVGGYTSYPRTSSQQLPKEIGYEKILKDLSKQPEYESETDFLLKKAKKSELKPNNGEKTDPAHPAIYPTGVAPRFKTEWAKKMYDLIVRRFFSTFGDPAKRETVTAIIECKDEPFITKGTTTVEKGWFTLYGRHVMLKEEELPKMEKGDKIHIQKIEKLDKETTPPKRYSEASIIKALEKENLGTKATRAAIIDTLFQRGFIDGKSITATELGMKTEQVLEKYSPKIVDSQLTRHFEEEMDEIREDKKTEEEVLEEAKVVVSDIITHFKKHMKNIGEDLIEANKETRNSMTYVGKCPNCTDGELFVRKGKFGEFIACNKYPDCKTTFSLPKAKIRPTKEICEHCKLPIITVTKKRGPQKLCINSQCPGKTAEYTEEQKKSMADIKGGEKKHCPLCKEGQLVVRNSIFGAFIGCNAYPKCRYTEKMSSGPMYPKKEKKVVGEDGTVTTSLEPGITIERKGTIAKKPAAKKKAAPKKKTKK